MILHNTDLGLELTARAFPNRADARAIAMQHIIEDLGRPYPLSDWLGRCDPRLFPRVFKRRLEIGKEGIIDLVAARLHPAAKAAVEDVHAVLTLPVKFAPEYPDLAYCVLMNAAGPGIVRRICGAPRQIEHEHGKCIVDMAWIAEAIIFTMFGRIPDLGEVVRGCLDEPGRRAKRQNAELSHI